MLLQLDVTTHHILGHSFCSILKTKKKDASPNQHTWTDHLLSLAEAQKADAESLQLQQDVVDSRVGVAGQQHTEPTGVKDANLKRGE